MPAAPAAVASVAMVVVTVAPAPVPAGDAHGQMKQLQLLQRRRSRLHRQARYVLPRNACASISFHSQIHGRQISLYMAGAVADALNMRCQHAVGIRARHNDMAGYDQQHDRKPCLLQQGTDRCSHRHGGRHTSRPSRRSLRGHGGCCGGPQPQSSRWRPRPEAAAAAAAAAADLPACMRMSNTPALGGSKQRYSCNIFRHLQAKPLLYDFPNEEQP